MKLETVKKLNQLNNDFYEVIGQYFNHSRKHAWEGWFRLSKVLKASFENKPLKVLELGCGNGRFLEFLLDQGFEVANYVGFDASEFLLARAKERLQDLNFTKASFTKVDILFDDWQKILDDMQLEKFDLVCMFGVMHHIPGKNYQFQLLENSVQGLVDSGLFVFTSWQYLDVPRLSRRIVKKDNPLLQEIAQKYKFDLAEFADGDNILDWHRGQVAYRFSHYYSDKEISNYINLLKLNLVDSFEADGKEECVNRYYILNKNQL